MDETHLPDMELRNAIHKIEEFSKRSERNQKNPLHKTISLIRSFIFSGSKDQIEVLKAIEVINQQRHRISKLEQNLADSYTKTIEEYNGRLEKGFKTLPRIDLPNQNTVKKHFPPQSTDNMINSIRQTFIPVNLTKQYRELFQMKVLALLERYGIASNPEARHAVKKSPIIPAVEENPSTCTLSQTFTLFPGQVVKIMGISELDPKTQTICRLFPDTFSVSLESTQTGFPYPSQHTGWALSHVLIPECPHRPDFLEEKLYLFYQRKKNIVKELQPSGALIDKAKKLLRLKKIAFDERRKEYLALHQKLVLTMLNAAPKELVMPGSVEIIQQFFQELEASPSPYEKLSETYQNLNEQYIASQHNQLVYSILHDLGSPLKSKDAEQRKNAAEKVLDAVLIEQSPQEDFVYCLGKVLGPAVKNILLQYFSEDLRYEPNELNDFEKKLQTAAFQQAEDFFDELEQLSEEVEMDQIYSRLVRQLDRDIALFINEKKQTADHLASYYKLRHKQKSNFV